MRRLTTRGRSIIRRVICLTGEQHDEDEDGQDDGQNTGPAQPALLGVALSAARVVLLAPVNRWQHRQKTPVQTPTRSGRHPEPAVTGYRG